MQLSAQIIAQLLDGSVEGDPLVEVNRPSRIEEGGEGTITFLGNLKYESYLYSTTASIVLINDNYQLKQQVKPTLIRVADIYAAVAVLQEKFSNAQQLENGIASSAIIDEDVTIAPSASIGANSVISKGVVIEGDCQIFPQVYLGENVTIGEGTILFPGVKIMAHCKVGKNCIIHPNTVIGSDGFGFAPQKDGTYKKIAQLGNVIIEDDVEIGANVAIDRGSMGATIIGSGAKLDNLIHVAHNVKIGKNTVMAAQAGVAGSTIIGENCQVGGQVGFVGHIQIADGTLIQAQSGIAASVEERGSKLFGSPAIGYSNYLRSYSVFKNLPEIFRRINKMEERIRELEHRDSSY